ncbi:MAG: phosphatidate cytidylyltransferase [Bacteroidales bacterium]|nr:phosphatidate cytidylyltransferase [Bacteroidales bacterium]
MKNFWIRTASATIYAALFLGTMLSNRLLHNDILGTAIFAAFLIFVALGCTHEFYKISAMKGANPNRMIGGTFVFVVLALMAMATIGCLDYQPSWLMAPAAAMLLIAPVLLLLPFLLQLWGHSESPFADAACTLVPIVYIAVPLGLMPFLHLKVNIMLMLLILVWVNDSFAYMGGSLFGKHKLWQRHSPGKTWEGSICGLIFTVAVALFVGPLLNSSLLWYDWVVLAFICSVIDTLGDLLESMLKRSVGLKDSGNVLPGHGGFLDRFDSLLVVVPFAFVYSLLILIR